MRPAKKPTTKAVTTATARMILVFMHGKSRNKPFRALDNPSSAGVLRHIHSINPLSGVYPHDTATFWAFVKSAYGTAVFCVSIVQLRVLGIRQSLDLGIQ